MAELWFRHNKTYSTRPEVTRENYCNCGALESSLAGHKPWCAFVEAITRQPIKEKIK